MIVDLIITCTVAALATWLSFLLTQKLDSDFPKGLRSGYLIVAIVAAVCAAACVWLDIDKTVLLPLPVLAVNSVLDLKLHKIYTATWLLGVIGVVMLLFGGCKLQFAVSAALLGLMFLILALWRCCRLIGGGDVILLSALYPFLLLTVQTVQNAVFAGVLLIVVSELFGVLHGVCIRQRRVPLAPHISIAYLVASIVLCK